MQHFTSLQNWVLAWVFKADLYQKIRKASVKWKFLYKHFFSPLSVSCEEGYCVKGSLGSVTHLPAMLPCFFEDHLSVASLKCFYKGERVNSP